jgi:hypothetical protein
MIGSLGSFEFVGDAVEKSLNDFQEEINDFRNHVVVDPNFHLDSSQFKFRGLSLKELQGLAIVSWFLGDIGWKIRADLFDHLKFLSLEDQFLIEILIDNRARTLNWLNETTLFHTRDFFGNLLPNAIRALRFLKFRNPNTRLKRIQRKRGYNDHGSRADDSYWKYARDYLDDEFQQNLLEQKRQIHQDTLSFLEGWVS